MFYTVMGVILLGMACIGAVLFIWQDMRDRRNTMPWKKRPPKKGYSEEFLASIEKAYEAAGSIRGMLQIMEEKYPKEKRRAEIALAYLDYSRYKDFETTLDCFSDGSIACKKALEEVLLREIQKRQALVCREH